MRLFVAIEIGDATRAQLRRVHEQLERLVMTARHAPKLTWAAPDRAHVTLRFIGEVTERQAASVHGALAAPVSLRPFDVEWSGVGAFPGARRPRVVWMGAAKGGAQLGALADQVNKRLDPLLGPAEERTFHAHLTVARVRDAGRVDWARALAALHTGVTATHIDRVTLFQSHLSPKGPTYTSLVTAGLIDA